jgi:hypothetical protein
MASTHLARSLLNSTVTIRKSGNDTIVSFVGKPLTTDIVVLLEIINKVLSLYPPGNHVIDFDLEEKTFMMSITYTSGEAVCDI